VIFAEVDSAISPEPWPCHATLIGFVDSRIEVGKCQNADKEAGTAYSSSEIPVAVVQGCNQSKCCRYQSKPHRFLESGIQSL
jgi:hypothetical protein